MALSPTGSKGLGVFSVNGRKRSPFPPAIITTSIGRTERSFSISNDVYRPYIRGGVHDDKKEILVSRVVMTIVGLVGLGVALTASNIISVMMSAFALRSAGPFAAFIGGLFCKNVTKDAGFLSILSGTAVAAYWTYALKSPFGLSAMVPGGIVAFAVLFIVSKYQISRGVEAAAPIELDKE